MALTDVEINKILTRAQEWWKESNTDVIISNQDKREKYDTSYKKIYLHDYYSKYKYGDAEYNDNEKRSGNYGRARDVATKVEYKVETENDETRLTKAVMKLTASCEEATKSLEIAKAEAQKAQETITALEAELKALTERYAASVKLVGEQAVEIATRKKEIAELTARLPSGRIIDIE